MDENNLSLDDVIDGLRRLRSEDVEALIKDTDKSTKTETSWLRKPASRESKTERMSSLRRKLSERLVSVKNETACSLPSMRLI